MANKITFKQFPDAKQEIDGNTDLFLIGYSGKQSPDANALYERKFNLNDMGVKIFEKNIYIKDYNNKWHQIYIDGNDDDGYYFVIGNAIDKL